MPASLSHPTPFPPTLSGHHQWRQLISHQKSSFTLAVVDPASCKNPLPSLSKKDY